MVFWACYRARLFSCVPFPECNMDVRTDEYILRLPWQE